MHDSEDTSGNTDLPYSLLSEHGDYLFRFAMIRVKDVDLAEEMVQETLLKAIKAHEKFRGDSSLRTWLSQILKNEIANHFRKRERETRFLDQIESDSQTSLSSLLRPQLTNDQFQSAVEREEFWKIINDCMSKLPEHLFEAFTAKWKNEGKKTEELCKDLGINSSNFSVRLFRSRLLLRKCIESNWTKSD